MEKPANWPPSENINPIFLSFHLNPTSKKKMLTETGINYLKSSNPLVAGILTPKKFYQIVESRLISLLV